ncbi:TIGR02301 family protein [Afifella pfennigii]|uniref:TIGR02301 family protein n=1 Tax=Afifella pfennigii TaxID=209897 RepID=UPI000551E60B|nr:TIGR02301 family protein [Afifella pfennigii]
MRFLSLFIVLAFMAGGVPARALAQDAPEEPETAAPSEAPPPIYEPKLLRLAELLGALHFLRGLCEAGDGPAWKADMEALLAAEAPGPQRRARLIGRFNHGFETYHSVYRSCTPAAQQSITLYLQESAEIAADIRTRYGQ